MAVGPPKFQFGRIGEEGPLYILEFFGLSGVCVAHKYNFEARNTTNDAGVNVTNGRVAHTQSISRFADFVVYGIKCQFEHGARELCIVWNSRAVFNANDKEQWRMALHCVFQSVVFDCESGDYRGNKSDEILKFGDFIFNQTKERLSAVSAVQQFVKGPYKKDLPDYPTVQALFDDAPDPEFTDWPDVSLIESALHSTRLPNIYDLLVKCKDRNILAWPAQISTTSQVGGGMIHLGLTLALSNLNGLGTPELRDQYCKAASPLQLCVLNATITKLMDSDGYNFELDANVTEVGLAYLPYIFRADMKAWYRCIDDLSTLKMNGNPVSLEIKTRWTSTFYDKNDLREIHWQAALQAYVTSVHMGKRINPAVLAIKIPEQKQVDTVKMNLSKPIEEASNRTGRNTLKILFDIVSKNPDNYAFCNGRLLLPWGTVQATIMLENNAHMHADVHLEPDGNDLPSKRKVPLVRTPHISSQRNNTNQLREWGLKFKHLKFFGHPIGLYYTAFPDMSTKFGIYFQPPKTRIPAFSRDHSKILMVCLLATKLDVANDGAYLVRSEMTKIRSATINGVKSATNINLGSLQEQLKTREGINLDDIIADKALFERAEKVFREKCPDFVP